MVCIFWLLGQQAWQIEARVQSMLLLLPRRLLLLLPECCCSRGGSANVIQRSNPKVSDSREGVPFPLGNRTLPCGFSSSIIGLLWVLCNTACHVHYDQNGQV